MLPDFMLRGNPINPMQALNDGIDTAVKKQLADVALNAAKNAGILAAEIIGTCDEAVSKKIADYKSSLNNEVIEKVEKLKKDGWENGFD